jgi:hypothetical protein
MNNDNKNKIKDNYRLFDNKNSKFDNNEKMILENLLNYLKENNKNDKNQTTKEDIDIINNLLNM